MVRQYFEYGTPAAGIPMLAVVGAVGNVTINIMQDAPFECVYIKGLVTQVGLVVVNWGGTIQIEDSGAGRTLYNNAVPFSLVCGSAQQPYVLLVPRVFPQNSSVTITVTNNVAVATVAHVVFGGYKLLKQVGE